ncbi:MAG: HTTM domain-containing protein [Myxococcota bacterium]
MSALREACARVFALDLRSLGVFRILLGVLVLGDAWSRGRFAAAFYSDAGFLPRALAREVAPEWVVPIHFWSGAPSVETALLAVSGVLATLLILGIAPRWMCLSLWVLGRSLVQRNPMASYGADSLLLWLLFWGAWLPLGERFAWRRGGRASDASPTVWSAASVGLSLQVLWLYVFAGVEKTGPMWFDGTALNNALGLSYWQLPVGQFLRSFPALCAALTPAVLVFEVAGPLLLYSPCKTVPIRTVGILAFLGFQLGLGLSLDLGWFPLVSSLALVPLIPGALWDRWGAAEPRWSAAPRWTSGVGASLAVAGLLVASVGVGVGFRLDVDLWPASLNRALETAGLQQRWEMFKNVPPFDTRLVPHGVLEDGRRVDLSRFADPGWAPVREALGTTRGRRYQVWLATHPAPRHHQRMARWLCQQWRDAEVSEGALREVRLFRVRRVFTPDGGYGEPEPVLRQRVACN